ncbi:MAG: NTP transferase domain-containing protein [Ignavibacteria bacterium]|jgi:mannose-1-phosphate guanylyltransferase/phosphomannomutase|nr:NTP transferase domain-containing protein [Ignavibacteria bacterium]
MNKAVIMAGGFGTRLRPLTMQIPKPMVPIMNQPMMEHIVNLLKQHNIKDVVSVLYFQPDVIVNHFTDGTAAGVKMQYVQAVADYGTAGSVRNAGEHLKEPFIIISGDVLTDFDLSKAIEFHNAKKSKATILLTRHPTPLQYGIVMTAEDGKITRFLEKPSWGQVFSDTINTGIYILEPDVLDMIPYREEFDFSKDLFPAMLAKNMPLYGYIAEGYWRDVGNLDEYQTGQNDALNGVLKVQYTGVDKSGVILGKNTEISPTAKFHGKVIIGDNTKIDEYSELVDCVIGNNVTIGKGVKLTRVTLWDNIVVNDFAQMVDDVVCNDVEIGESASVYENVFIANNCKIGKSSVLHANIKLWPNKSVEEGAILSRSLVQEEKWQRELFSEARISGISNVDIHPEFCAKLGAAFGLAIGVNKTIVTSRAPDNCSRIMKRALSAGLASVGISSNDMQVSSIPQTRQELRSGKFDAGVHIRRSPRYPNMHDIILFSKDGKDISTDTAKKVERYFFGEDVARVAEEAMGRVVVNSHSNESYVQKYIASIDVEKVRERKFKILVDYSYGLSATILPNVLGYFDADVISIHNFVDQRRFIPARIENESEKTNAPIDEISSIMKNLNYEIGFQIEAGAEKISIIDQRGVWYTHHRLLCIVTKLFLETHKHLEPYKIGISILAGAEIEEIAKDYNVEVVRIKNSHAAMMQATNDEKMLYVGGSYGGFVFRDFLFASDGMFAVGQILEMLAKTGKHICDLDEELPRRFQSMRTIPVPWEKKGLVMRKAMEFSENLGRQLVEGVKIFKDGSSILLYPEKETPNFTIVTDSDDFKTAESLCKTYAAYIVQWKEEV